MAGPDNGSNGTIPFRELIDQQLDRLKGDIENRTDVLREVYNERIANIAERVTNLQNLVDQHFDAQEKAVEKALAVQEQSLKIALVEVQKQNDLHAAAHAREHTAQNIAIDKSEKHNDERFTEEHRTQAVAIEKSEKRVDERFHEHNAFRAQIEGERLLYVRRDMLDMAERNNRETIEKMEADIRLRMEKMDADTRMRIEKVELDLRQRLEAEAASRMLATSPLWTWQSNMTGRLAVAGVAGTILITAVVFLANYLTAH